MISYYCWWKNTIFNWANYQFPVLPAKFDETISIFLRSVQHLATFFVFSFFKKKNDPKHFHESVGFPCEWQASGGKHGTMIQDERDLASSQPGNMRLHNMLYVVIGCEFDMIILYSSILLTHQKWLMFVLCVGFKYRCGYVSNLATVSESRKPNGVKIVSYRFRLPGQPGYPILYPYWNCQTLGAYRVLTHIQISEASGTSRCCKTTAGYSSGLAHCAWSVFSYSSFSMSWHMLWARGVPPA